MIIKNHNNSNYVLYNLYAIFLQSIHRYYQLYFQFAFEVISQLWDELYAYSGMKTLKNEIGPITEHVIVILKHLLKGMLVGIVMDFLLGC